MDIRDFYSSNGNFKKTNTTRNTTKSTNMTSNQLVTYPSELFPPPDSSDDSDGEQADYLTHLDKNQILENNWSTTTGVGTITIADYETSEELRCTGQNTPTVQMPGRRYKIFTTWFLLCDWIHR